MTAALRYIEVFMPHISRQFLKGNLERKLVLSLIENITRKGNAKSRSALCSELLTGTERLMLAKRLAVVCLLGKGVPFEQISKELKVSSSTVARLWTAMQQGKFKETIRTIKLSKLDKFILSFFTVLLAGARPRYAPRWKFLKDL